MPTLINGEPFIHGLDPDVDAATAGGTNPTTDALAHQQNTDRGTTKSFFELGLLSSYANAGAVRRGIVFNPGGAGPITAFAWEARTEDGTATGRFVQCLRVLNGDPKDPGNVWDPAELALGKIKAGDYGANPDLTSFGQAIKYLLNLSNAKTPPVIGGFNPVSGVVGSTVLINGNNFGASTGTVQISGKPASVQGWSNYQISVRIPAGATTDKFTVTTAGGSDISRDSFTVTSAVVVSTPGPVGGLTAVGGSGQVILQWAEPADTGNSPITDYLVQYRLAGATTWTTYAHSVRTVPNITVNGLSPGTGYEFQVAPKNVKGTGQLSAVASATTTATSAIFYAVSQTYTTTQADLELACGTGTTATPVTESSSDGTSTNDQGEADRRALARAKNLAIQGIVCPIGTSTGGRNIYDVPGQKRVDIITANKPSVPETDETMYEKVFYDMVTQAPVIMKYHCGAAPQVDNTTRWFWFRSEVK